MATSRKKTTTTAKKRATATKKRRTVKKSDLDRRWSILLFGIGALLMLLSFVAGESAWAWVRENILFGAFGVSGWLLGPCFLYWAYLVGKKESATGPAIRCILFLLALSGAALIFSRVEVSGLKFGELLALLIETGKQAKTASLLSVLFGWPLLALCGRPVANILVVLLVIITVMLVTHVTPADIVRYIAGLVGRIPRYEVEYDEEEDEMPPWEQQEMQPKPKAAPPLPKRSRKKAVDIDLGPEAPVSVPGLGESDDVTIGPGGTFGMDPLGKKELFSEAKPDVEPEEPILPFDPHSPRSLYDGPVNTKPLFGEHEPAAPAVVPPPGAPGLFSEDAPADNLFGARPSTLFSEKVAAKAAVETPAADMVGGAKAAEPVELFAGAASAPPEPDLFGRPQQAEPPKQSLFADVPPAGNAGAGEPDLFGQVGGKAPIQFPKEKPGVVMAGEVKESAAGEAYDESLFDKAMAESPDAAPAKDERPKSGLFQSYKYPPVTLFTPGGVDDTSGARDEMQKTADLLVNTLESFGVQTRILDVSRGPTVTRYEIQPQTGVKISRITNLADDIALNLAAAGVRIEAPIPGKPAVGIEVPNRKKSMVSIRSILESKAFAESTSPLTIALGKDIAGDPVVADLTKMPHLLVAGSTGSGKSVCINSIIMSVLYKSSPEDVRIMLIDPKVVELAEYNGVPHLLMPVVTEPRKAAGALGQMVAEMEKRYHTFAENNVRDIKTYNKLAARNGSLEKMPYIAIVIDELADLMMTSGKEVEDYICRIAQKARAAGMHLIVATQRPSVDVITGLIKANIPSRIAFAVSSQVDSRTILDGAGAEKLLGMGDMLFMPVGANKPVRVQGTYVKDDEITDVIDYIKDHSGEACYDEDFIKQVEDRIRGEGSGEGGDAGDGSSLADPTFIQAVDIALEQGQISTSFLQRRLRLGYARAGRIMDEMQQMGIISAPEGSKPRQVLINRQQWIEMSMNGGPHEQLEL